MPFYRSVRGFLEGILLFCIAYIQPLAAQSGPYLEVDGLLIMEAENTASQLDSDSNNPWVSLSPGDNHYEDGATGEEYIEFAGNGPAGGDPRSPLEYTFKINKGGNYAMAFRSHKRLQGQPDDRCNDAYVRMAGNFDRADRDETNRPTWNVSNLEIDKKIYLSGEGHGWGVAGTLEHLEQVNNRHRPARYKFIAGETYTLTVSGRSERYGIDRIIFWHDDLADEFAKDSALEESLREGDPNAGLPIADAGSDQVITLPDGDVTLDGSNSSDPGGNIDSYLWTQLPGGPNTAILSGETTDTLSASGLIEGTYVFELTVTDSDNNTASDTVTVTVAEASAAVIKGDLMRWHKVTLELDGPPATETGATNPFADYRMIVTFTHPGTGLTYNVPGYFAADGDAANTSATSGNKWHAHLSPDEIGHWDYTISFREGTDVAVDSSPDAGTVMPAYDGLSGSFTVSETDKTGRDFRAKGRLTYVGENYLQFSGTGEYFIKAGSDSPENLLAYDDFDDTPNALTGPKGDREYRKTWNPHAGDYSALDASDYTWDNGRGTELLGALRYLGELEGLNSFSFITFTVDADDDNVFPHLLRSDVAGYESIPQDNDDESPTGGRWGHPTHGLHPDRFDVSKLAQWGLIMDYATKKGMFMDIKTQEEENDRKMDGGSLGLERKLYYRELIARFGHNLGLQWNLGEEVNYHSEFNDQEQDRIKSFAEYFQANDPYNHLLTVHSLAGQDDQDDIYDPLLGNQSVLTGASVQTTAVDLTDVFTSAKKWSEASNQAGTPWVVFIDEPGSAAYGVKTDNDGLTKQHDTWTDGVEYEESEKHEYARKNALWGSIMGGSAGINFYFGFLSRKYDGSDEGQSDQWAENFRSRDLLWDYARYMLEFFEINEIPVTEMSNYGNLTPALGSWVFAKPGDTYMVYLRDGGSETLDLSGVSGTFDVSWYDPRNGGAMQNGSVTSIEGGSTVSLGDAPNTSDNDWLVLVQKPTVSGPADPYNLQAIVDFPDIDAGAVPYTVDGARNALQIDATVEENRGPFARATTTFFGEAGSYDVTIATIGEYDGESQYRFYVNGVQVGTTVTNDSTNQGFDPQTHVIATGVQIPAGATLAVESNAASNGEVLEGDPPEPAWARGRWTGLSFTQVNTPPAGPAVVSLTLVNATTDQPVPGFDPIPNGAVINTVDIGTTNLNIIASTDPDSDFGSVVFSLSGAEAHNQTESVMPFVLYGDAGSGDYNDNTFDNGTYTLS
ncbi:MAG: PKD domain-containing protein, partial [Opitutales bacterium]